MRPNILGLHHDHIDGSRAVLDVLDELYALNNGGQRFPSAEALRAHFHDPLTNIVGKFAAVTGLMQTQEALELVGHTYGKRRAAEGYRYVEAKFAPQYHTAGGLSLAGVVAAMLRGLERAERETGLVIMPIICIGRELTPEQGVEIAWLALDRDGEVGLDLVCDEAGHPPEKHRKAYAITFGTKVKRDCHAGEWVSPEPAATYRQRLLKNVRTAVYDLKADGIGHAIPLIDDPSLVAHIVNEGIRVSGCPLSNRACGQIKDVRELGIDSLLDRGVIYTLNPDDDLLFPPMAEVLDECDRAYGFTPEQCRHLEENVFRGAFSEKARNLVRT